MKLSPKELLSIKVCDGINLMDLCGSACYNSDSPKRSTLSIFFHLCFHMFKSKFKYNTIERVESRDKPQIWISVAQVNDRLLDLFAPLIGSILYDHIIVTKAKVPPGNYQTDCVKTLELKSSQIPFKLILKIALLSQFSWKDRLYLIDTSLVQYKIFRGFQRVVKNISPSCVIADLDRYPTTSPIILAAKQRGIPTISQVHGSIDPIINYVPTIADHLFLWGQYHLERFVSENLAKPKYHIVGNPKLGFGTKQNGIPSEPIIGLALTSLSTEDLKLIIEEFSEAVNEIGQGWVKKHPKDINRDVSGGDFFQNVRVLGSEVNAVDFLTQIDILVVRRSQMGSDALAYNIPVIVFDPIGHGDIQNGRLLNSSARCPLLHSSIELKEEFGKLKVDSNYLQVRMSNQKIFRDKLYAFVGDESSKQMIRAVNEIIKGNHR